MAKHEKPKPAAKITRNADRRNGKAFKKHPGRGAGKSAGGKYGYSFKRLQKMAAEQKIDIADVIDRLKEKLEARKALGTRQFKSTASRPGIGESVYKMDSVHRHFDKTKPYPVVPKGSRYAGKDKSENTTDRTQKNAIPSQRQGERELASVA